MSEKRPRFPCVAALLCAASLGAAAWTWMRYSYRWEVTPEQVFEEDAADYYVTMTATVDKWGSMFYPPKKPTIELLDASTPDRFRPGDYVLWSVRESPERDTVFPFLYVVARDTRAGATDEFVGRTKVARIHENGSSENAIVLDTTASRWHGASVAGLVVGAMGVFVFTLALRHWLRERAAGSLA